MGGSRIVCLINSSSSTVDLPTIKIFWNSVLSTPGAKYFAIDISNFYLNTPLDRPAFMRLPIKTIPQETIDRYTPNEIVTDGRVYIRIELSMYGLQMAGKLANNLLVKRMSKAGYHPCQYTPAWKHAWRSITFTLVAEDFGIKFKGKEHANHLKRSLDKHYEVTVDWKGSKYVGISLAWDYKGRTLHTISTLR